VDSTNVTISLTKRFVAEVEPMKRQQPLFRGWLDGVVAIAILAGLALRFANLDLKPYWHDEIYTLLSISGHSAQEAIQHLLSNQVISIGDMLRYQQPDAHTSLGHTLSRLIDEDPQHPPLYYGLSRLWAEWFGSSAIAVRGLSAMISMFELPLVYWLCQELFGSVAVGRMAVALVAISPLYIRYAQEARQYSLWLVLTTLSCIALLQALRCQTKQKWFFYALTVSASLYCHIFSILVWLAHGLYVWMQHRVPIQRSRLAYLLASSLAGISFLPWVWVLWTQRHIMLLTTAWMQQGLPLPELLQTWSVQLCQAFVAWYFRYNAIGIYLGIFIVALIGASLYHLCQRNPKRVWLFILLLIGVNSVCLMIPDLLWSDQRSANARYFLPAYLGIHLAVAHLLASKIPAPINLSIPTHLVRRSKQMKRKIWQGVTLLVIGCGLWSSATSVQASTWWGWSEFDVETPKIVNQSPHPLVISDLPLGFILPLSHRLNPNTHLLLSTNPDAIAIPKGFSDVFVYNPSAPLKAKLQQQGFDFNLVYQFQDRALIVSLYQLTGGERHDSNPQSE
jgi:uncharacterized membrane protein